MLSTRPDTRVPLSQARSRKVIRRLRRIRFDLLICIASRIHIEPRSGNKSRTDCFIIKQIRFTKPKPHNTCAINRRLIYDHPTFRVPKSFSTCIKDLHSTTLASSSTFPSPVHQPLQNKTKNDLLSILHITNTNKTLHHGIRYQLLRF